MEYKDAVIIILIAFICIVFFVFALKKSDVCCSYCGAVMSHDGTAKKPPTTTPATTTTEGFAPVNTVLTPLSPMDVRTMGALPLATGEENHKRAGPNEFLIQDTPMGQA